MIVADVQITDTLDGLIVVPRLPQDGHRVSGMMVRALPGARLSRRSGGVVVADPDAATLLAMSESMTELKWNSEAVRYVENRNHVRRIHAGVLGQVREIRSGTAQDAALHLADMNGLSALDNHQVVNVAAMTVPDGFGLCVFDEQGAGKTVTFIFAFDVLVGRDQADFALIVAPKSMIAEWPRDFHRFKGDLYKTAIVAGTPREKRAALASGADVFVTNFETVVTMEAELRAMLRNRPGRGIFAVDESFYAKNVEARRTQSLRRLREWCGRAFVLCGTPAPNAPQDLVQQFNIVDFGFTFAGVNIPDNRDAARPVIQQAIEERGLYVRHLKADVLPDLPIKQFHRILVPLQPDQRRLYEGALNDFIVDLRSTTDEEFQRHLGSYFARRSALLQICSNPAGVARGYTELPAKLLALDSLLTEVIRNRKEKVVLWSFYTATIEAILVRYSEFMPVRYDGTVSDVAERREAVRRFQEDETTMLFVANPAAAGAGLTLHKARLAIYESMSNQAAHYLQSLDRIHRRGQTRDVEYMILLCEGTLELEEYERLMEKEHSAQQLLGDRVNPPITRQAMLSQAEDAVRLLSIHS